MLLRKTSLLTLAYIVFSVAGVTSQGLSITSQPVDTSGVIGRLTSSSFRISVMGGVPPLTFTWYVNGTVTRTDTSPVTPATDIYTITPSTSTSVSSFVGRYHCIVTDVSFPQAQTVTSNTVQFTTQSEPVITQPPVNTTANVTSVVTFSCLATGVPSPKYKWSRNGLEIPNEVGSTLVLNLSDNSRDGDTYTCTASNTVSFRTATAYLSVVTKSPYFIVELSPVTVVNYGSQLTLSCLALGIPGVQYSWERSTPGVEAVTVTGANMPTLAVQTTVNATYACIADNGYGKNRSTTFVSVVQTAPVNSYMSDTVRGYVGFPLQIECLATGVPSPKISWIFQHTALTKPVTLPSQGNRYYYKAVAQKSDQGRYTCVSSNIVQTTKGPNFIYVIIDNLLPPDTYTNTRAMMSTTATGAISGARTVPTTTPGSTPDPSQPASQDQTSGSMMAQTSTQAGTARSTTASTASTDTGNTVRSTTSTDSMATTSSRNSSVMFTDGTLASTPTKPNVTETDSNNSTVTIVVPIIVFIIIAGIILVIFLIYLTSMRSKLAEQSSPKKSLTKGIEPTAQEDIAGPELEMDVIASEQLGQESLTQLESTSKLTVGYTLSTLQDILSRVEGAIASGERSNELVAEYEGVPLNMVSMENCPSVLGTEHKNRYMNVLPNPETAVRLEEDPPGDVVSAYINANYVKDFEGKANAFIATQGPTADTINDFWRMVWQNDVSVIVMATQLVERGRAKCMRYWPDAESTQQYGNLTVTVDDVSDHPDYLLTTMAVYNSEADRSTSRTVRHFWFKSWPDFGIPLHTEPVLNFIDTIVAINSDKNAPIIIHCSAGIGRTGTLIAVRMGMQQFERDGCVYPAGYLDTLRQCRGGCIQTFDQYLFIHRALLTHMAQCSSSADDQGPAEEVPLETDASDTNLV